MSERPVPLGVTPQYIWDAIRKRDLKAAIERYLEAGLIVPIEWFDEYNGLTTKVHKND